MCVYIVIIGTIVCVYEQVRVENSVTLDNFIQGPAALLFFLGGGVGEGLVVALTGTMSLPSPLHHELLPRGMRGTTMTAGPALESFPAAFNAALLPSRNQFQPPAIAILLRRIAVHCTACECRQSGILSNNILWDQTIPKI